VARRVRKRPGWTCWPRTCRVGASLAPDVLGERMRRYDVPEEAAVRLLYLIQSTQRLGAALSYSGAKADSRMIRVSSMPRRQ
jgi:hypothetical protein